MTFSRLILLIHRWAGVASFVFLVVINLTGSVLVYARPIDRLLTPELRHITPGPARRPLAATLDTVRATHPGAELFFVRRGAADEPDEVMLRPWRRVAVNPYTGAILGERNPNRTLVGLTSALHGSLLAGRIGHTLVGIAGLIVLLEAVTGLIRWWRYKTFWIAKGANFRRLMFDLHNASGLYALLLVLPLTVTGLMFSFGSLINRALDRLDHPVPVAAVAPTADSGRALGPDDAVRLALAARPGELVQVMLPRGASDPWQVQIRPAGDHSNEGRVRATVGRGGAVTSIVDGGPGQRGTFIQYLRDGIHGGWIWGGAGMLLAAIGGVLVAFQALTGFVVWWKPRLPA